ncbi:FMN-dependent NADH-azoreductase [Thalassocella blandensis]|nr:FMN-dependent NADH-azoreductase [Thalassocella blandensis]
MSINVLNITSSIFGESGVSSQLNDYTIEQIKTQFPDANIVNRDLAKDELPHFNAQTVAAVSNNEADLADTLIDELKAADLVLLGVPMYNFGVPSQLKTWFDHVARAGTTFKYTENGPIGLLQNRKVIINASRGGIYKDSGADTQTPYLQNFLGFIGLKDVDFIYAEGLNLGEDSREQSLSQAKSEVESTVAQFVKQHAKAEAEEAI